MKTQHDIYHSILSRAADEWKVPFEDTDRDIAQHFDPIVRFLAGACASELERVYEQLDATESRLQKRLARLLLPEYYHLPQPAHALATATPTADAVLLDETTAFIREAEDQKSNVAFSPLFPMRLLPVRLRLVATETQLLDLEPRPTPRQKAEIRDEEEVRRILIGFEAPAPVLDWQGACLWLDLRERSGNVSEKVKFFAALSNCRCFLDGQELGVSSGLPAAGFLLEDYLNGNERLQTQVRARYERQFITFTAAEVPATAPRMAQEFLPRWFALANADDIKNQMSRLAPELKQPLHWLEIRLPHPVTVDQLASRLAVRFNVFPVVNRRLCGAGRNEHEYLKQTDLKWIHLKAQEDFSSIRRVYEEKAPDYTTFIFKPFAKFRGDDKPAYTLRHGGLGRWDEFNAWQRLAYVVAILQDNFEYKDLLDKAAASLSLEDVHHLLGKKISETAAERKPASDIYVLLHAGSRDGVRVRIEYWTSQGAAANGIPAKSPLKCTARAAANFHADSVELVSKTEGGHDPLEASEELDALKSALLRRGRIVTREDVKIRCRELLRDKLAEVHVKDGVGADPRSDFGMTRLLDVQLMPAPAAIGEDWEGICQQMQTLLEQESASSIPIQVRLVPKKTTVASWKN